MKKKELTTEGLADLAYKAESDHEVQMARAELYKVAKYAIKLHEMMKGVSEADGLEGWVQAKITKAADYISSVYHHMDYETKFDEVAEAKKSKPDFLDVDKDGDKKEPMKKALKDKGSKPKKGEVPPQFAKKESSDYKTSLSKMLENKLGTCKECGKPSYTTLPEEKQKGVDGKVCWKGYKRMGTKKKGGKTVDNCVKM
jgi:RNA polymerase-binding transcription factor DksA